MTGTDSAAQSHRLRATDREWSFRRALKKDRPSRSETEKSVHYKDERVKILDFGIAKLTTAPRQTQS
jgi:hypothetical protein